MSPLQRVFLIFVTAHLLVSAGAAQVLPPGQLPPEKPPQPGQLGPPASKLPDDTGATAEGTASSPTFRVNRKLVFVPTTVTDKRTGNYIDGLTARDFELYDNDKPQKIESDLIAQPLSVVVTVQANSEVDPVISKLRGTGLLVQGLVSGQDGDAAILAFDHRMQVLQDFTNDPGKLDDAMHRLTAGSSTAALIDAVIEADHMLKRRDPQNLRHRVILLISRDEDKGSEARLRETVRNMQFDNITVYCVNISKLLTSLLKKPGYPARQNGGVPPEALPNLRGNGAYSETGVVQQEDGNVLSAAPLVARSVHDLFKKTPAEAFATFTGGRVYNFASERSLERAISDIGRDLNSQYILTYTPTNETDPGFHTIRVVVNRPGLAVDPRPGYWTAGGPQQ